MRINDVDLDAPIEIPASIGIAMGKDPYKGVCVIYKDEEKKEWSYRGLDGSRYDKGLITKIIKDGKWNDSSREFVIVDPKGRICYKTSDDIQVQVDANGYVHVGDEEYLVKIIDDPRVTDTMCYIGGKDLAEINHKVEDFSQIGFMYKPKGFGANGFEDGPIPVSSQPGE